ncbi:hypothetical protein [Methylocapsa sp. S129]|uniref:hypothetical protein n=1 Tax=Methylocapsa sp. S129 TaxID=1641869 RepID=UPI00131DDBD8|nr:hypothetical protein [Methylocapsa sp. S129]
MSYLIRDYLDELQNSFAAAPPIDSSVLKTLYDRQDYAAMLGWIKNSMRLDLRVGLRIVDAPDSSPPMWIEIPQPMPRRGTAEFRETRVIVNARRDVLEAKSFVCVVAGFSHELSHAVLSAMDHRLQHEEKAVDLTAMLLGYQSFIGDAEVTKMDGLIWSLLLMAVLLPTGFLFWRSTTKTWRLGYLTRAEAAAARDHLAPAERLRA